MAVLYLTEQGSVVRKTGDRLVVQKDGQVLCEVPCLKLETVLLYGNVQVTSQALAELLDHGIELALLTTAGKLRGQLTPPKAKNVPLRMRQYDLARDAGFCLGFAREVVRAKVENAAAVLRRYRANHPEAFPLSDVLEVEKTLERLPDAPTLASLLGLEGTAANRYFGALAAMVPPELGFAGRTRRPPQDPFNALLSFGYVLVGNELQSLLDAMGFDPYVGFYHQIDYGRPSLALDLLEEFRAPLVDRWSASLLNRRLLGPDDFRGTPQEGVLLRREAMKRYFPLYEKELTTPFAVDGEELTFRQLFRRQAERLARALLQGEPYRGFRLPC